MSNLIKVKQIEPGLTDFIKTVTSGNIDQAILSYAATGYHGPNVVYSSGVDQNVLGNKTFLSPVGVPYSGGATQTISQQYVVDQVASLQSKINTNAVGTFHTTGNETAQGVKTFDSIFINQGISGSVLNFTNASFSTNALVPTVNLFAAPDLRSAVNLSFFYNQGLLFTTGFQSISDYKEFVYAPSIVNPATGFYQAARFDQITSTGAWLQQQIDALSVASGSQIGGFGGVLSFNGQSGNIFALGRGGITIKQQGNLTFVSGSLPVVTGSGVYLIQGDQGLPGLNLNPRGAWTTGISYGYLDFISQSGNAYVATTGHLSLLSNMPGTGGSLAVAPWQLFFSGGVPGPTGLSGAWQYQGTYNNGQTYFYNNAVSLNGGVYGFSGSSIAGLSPTGLLSGWYLLIPSGSIGPVGAVGPTGGSGAWQYRGTHNFGTTYAFNNAVSYNGATYGFSGNSSVGFSPDTGVGWYVIAQSGIQGLQGPAAAIFTWRGQWLSTGNYISGDAIYYNGSSFATQLPASGTTPGTGIPWQLIVSGATGPTGSIGPTGVIGPSGAWQYVGSFNFSNTYGFNNAVSYSGSTYGFSGGSTIGFAPTTGTGWYIIAASGQKGDQGIQGGQGPQGQIGPVGNFSGTITGNFTNISFYLDFPMTGLYLSEAFTSQSFNFTGYAIGCVTSGRGPLHLSSGYSGVPLVNQMTGSLYYRDLSNVITEITPFSFNSGLNSKVSGNFARTIPSLSRIGLSLYSGLSGLRGLTFMVAGF
jgi:hypothetical protein